VIPLPHTYLNVEGSVRESAPYNKALEAQTAAVYHEVLGTPPMERVALTVVYHVQQGRTGDNRFRPEGSNTIWPTLDAVYLGIIRAGIVTTTAQIPLTAVALRTVPDGALEGVALILEEIERPEVQQ
jgi:hypothetical protein